RDCIWHENFESKPCAFHCCSWEICANLFSFLLFSKVAHSLDRGAKVYWALTCKHWLVFAQPSGNHSCALICKRSEL
uniref:Uncharacterized protein n=1 Tax=Catharus ustulatus TaxID=91951 RepID=A0A8C3UTY6_CATUS